MASSFIVRHLDERHHAALDHMRRKYGTTAISTAISRLLDDYMEDMQYQSKLEAEFRQLAVLVNDMTEQRAAIAQAQKRIDRAAKDAAGIAKDAQRMPRQLSINDYTDR